jgi:hypothetical protein
VLLAEGLQHSHPVLDGVEERRVPARDDALCFFTEGLDEVRQRKLLLDCEWVWGRRIPMSRSGATGGMDKCCVTDIYNNNNNKTDMCANVPVEEKRTRPRCTA